MRKTNNFMYVTNVQHGACLLFDRKGQGCTRSWALINDGFIGSCCQLLQVTRRRITENIRHTFAAAF